MKRQSFATKFHDAEKSRKKERDRLEKERTKVSVKAEVDHRFTSYLTRLREFRCLLDAFLRYSSEVIPMAASSALKMENLLTQWLWYYTYVRDTFMVIRYGVLTRPCHFQQLEDCLETRKSTCEKFEMVAPYNGNLYKSSEYGILAFIQQCKKVKHYLFCLHLSLSC